MSYPTSTSETIPSATPAGPGTYPQVELPSKEDLKPHCDELRESQYWCVEDYAR